MVSQALDNEEVHRNVTGLIAMFRIAYNTIMLYMLDIVAKFYDKLAILYIYLLYYSAVLRPLPDDYIDIAELHAITTSDENDDNANNTNNANNKATNNNTPTLTTVRTYDITVAIKSFYNYYKGTALISDLIQWLNLLGYTSNAAEYVVYIFTRDQDQIFSINLTSKQLFVDNKNVPIVFGDISKITLRTTKLA